MRSFNRLIKWLGIAVMASASSALAAPPPVYICGDVQLDAAALGPVQVMSFVDRDQVNPSNAWPISITQASLGRWLKNAPNGQAFMLDREDDAQVTLMRGTGKEQRDAASWFGRMMQKALDYRPKSPLGVWYIGDNYIWPADTFAKWWSGQSGTDLWATQHYQVARLAAAVPGPRAGFAVSVYAPGDEAMHATNYARLVLAPFLTLAGDVDCKVFAVVSERIWNGYAVDKAVEASDETVRAEVRAALDAIDSRGGTRHIDGVIYWNAETWLRRMQAPTKPELQILAEAKSRQARTLQIILEECGYVVPASPPAPVPTPEPPVVTPEPPIVLPPAPVKVPSPPIILGNGATVISNKVIGSLASRVSEAIKADNDKRVSLTITDVDAFSVDYALYAGSASSISLTRCNLNAAGGGNAYVVRGAINRYESTDCTFYAGHSWRVYVCDGGFSLRDIYDVDNLRVGGGASGEWDNETNFGPFTFSDGRIKARTQVTIYSNTHDVVFENMDFAGSAKIFIDWGAKNITFRNCRNMPAFRYHDAAGHQIYPSQADLAGRGILITSN